MILSHFVQTKPLTSGVQIPTSRNGSGAAGQTAKKAGSTSATCRKRQAKLQPCAIIQIKSAELEKEHRKLISSFDISMPKSKNITEVRVNAKTGAIVSTQVETPQEQAKEAAGDKKEKK